MVWFQKNYIVLNEFVFNFFKKLNIWKFIKIIIFLFLITLCYYLYINNILHELVCNCDDNLKFVDSTNTNPTKNKTDAFINNFKKYSTLSVYFGGNIYFLKVHLDTNYFEVLKIEHYDFLLNFWYSSFPTKNHGRFNGTFRFLIENADINSIDFYRYARIKARLAIKNHVVISKDEFNYIVSHIESHKKEALEEFNIYNFLIIVVAAGSFILFKELIKTYDTIHA